MKDLEKQFENYLSRLKFDDMPNPHHRDKLEKDLLETISRRQSPQRTKFWRIIMKSQITKLAVAAAIMLISITLVIKLFSGTDALAQIVKALENVKNVHITSQYSLGNGKEEIQHFWLRKPDGLREQGSGYETIDNGKDRLRLDKDNMTAQISDSWLKDKPVAQHYMFEQMQMFRNNNDKRIKIKKLAEESNDVIFAYSIYYEDMISTPEGKRIEVIAKAWVDAATMLPIKVEAALKGQADPNETQGGVITFDYEPIPDEVFSTDIPSGYRILPRKENAYITGKVIDENGNPVENAQVLIGAMRYKNDDVFTDKEGNFIIKLSPIEYMRPTLPLMIRAYKKDDPLKVAWTIIKRTDDKTNYDVKIPGKVEWLDAAYHCFGASGVELQMEPAGRIYGKVTDENGNPLQKAKVQVQYFTLRDKLGNQLIYLAPQLGGTGEEFTATAATDNEGRYEITNIPRFFDKTEFTLQAEAANYVTDQSKFRTAGPLDKKEVNLVLYGKTITINGIVKDNYGTPLDLRYIIISANGKEYPSCRTNTNKDGTFKIGGCPAAENVLITAELNHNSYPPHIPEKFISYIFYPPVSAQIELQPDKIEYEVELIANRPDNVLEVEVRNSAGELLPYFPVEIRAPGVSTEWQIKNNFIKRTDLRGQCSFTEIPDINELEIILYSSRTILNEKLDDEIKKIADEYKKIYFWNEIPVEFVESQKEYKIKATALTQNEWYELQKSKNK